jgi:hypothetical protein
LEMVGGTGAVGRQHLSRVLGNGTGLVVAPCRGIGLRIGLKVSYG